MKEIGAYSTTVSDYYFYFPSSGKFTLYPANISRNGEVYALSKQRTFEVTAERQTSRPDSINEILQLVSAAPDK
jgi:hypothetical protein